MPLLQNLRRVIVAVITGAAIALSCQAQTVSALPGGSRTCCAPRSRMA